MPTVVAWWAAIAGSALFITMLIPIFPHYVGTKALVAFVGFMIVGLVLFLAAGGQRKALSVHERTKNMFGDLNLDEMRKSKK